MFCFNCRAWLHIHAVLLVFAALAAPWCLATDAAPHRNIRYVATSGSDSNPGTLAAPYKTITKGVSVLAPGDTLYVRGGVYAESLVIRVSGTESAPVRILAYPNELPVIDGATGVHLHKYDPLVRLKGDYVQMAGFEVRNSTQVESAGVLLDGAHDIVSHMNVHHNSAAGILARGDNAIVEYSVVWQNAYLNCRAPGCPPTIYPSGMWATGVSAARNPIGGITHHAILRHNIVYNNWGEGLSSYEAEGTVIEDNVVYDNWATNTYISDSSNVHFSRNLVYTTADNAVGGRKLCFTLADERADKPRSANNVVVDNVCLNGDVSLFSWTMVPGSGLVNALFAYNTIVNGMLKTGRINEKSRIVNNIITGPAPLASVPSTAGLQFANNLWSQAPVENAMGVNSIVADPGLLQSEEAEAGQLTLSYFKPAKTSPARMAGVSLGDLPQTDILGRRRKSPPTIGAYEIP